MSDDGIEIRFAEEGSDYSSTENSDLREIHSAKALEASPRVSDSLQNSQVREKGQMHYQTSQENGSIAAAKNVLVVIKRANKHDLFYPVSDITNVASPQRFVSIFLKLTNDERVAVRRKIENCVAT